MTLLFWKCLIFLMKNLSRIMKTLLLLITIAVKEFVELAVSISMADLTVPKPKVTACQLFMRTFRDGEQITIEPWRAKSFPVIRDLITDRGAFERIIQAGGFISASTGSAPDGNAIPIPKADAEWAMDAAACIGCGACVAACKNASAMLFVSAKVAHLGKLPQGKVEAKKRVLNMIAQMDKEGFGSCTNTYACEAECPKGISVANIAYLNREFLKAGLS
jgi:succinate dehydrogenase / fumarate reductase iron-sulfur subunit